jgi:hypothetical protein
MRYALYSCSRRRVIPRNGTGRVVFGSTRVVVGRLLGESGIAASRMIISSRSLT